MPDLHADEDVSPAVVEALRAVGVAVTSVRNEGHLRRNDDEHLLFAHQQTRVFLTHNRKDFELLHDAWTNWRAAEGFTMPPHAGILILQRAIHGVLANEILGFLATDPKLEGEAYSWISGQGWARRINHGWTPYP